MNKTEANFKLFDTIATLPGGMALLENANLAFRYAAAGRRLARELLTSFATEDRDIEKTTLLMYQLKAWVDSFPEKK